MMLADLSLQIFQPSSLAAFLQRSSGPSGALSTIPNNIIKRIVEIIQVVINYRTRSKICKSWFRVNVRNSQVTGSSPTPRLL